MVTFDRPRSKAAIDSQAWRVLEQNGVTSYPVDPVGLATKLGIEVHLAMFRDKRISGVISKRGSVTRIYVNAKDSANRQRFTVAHELGHFFLHLSGSDGEMVDVDVDLFRRGDTPGENERAKKEIEANRFAASLLMPEDWVRDELKRRLSLSDLANAFRVSVEAMGNRIATLGIR